MMKKDLVYLLEKFEQGTCTKVEADKLYEFYSSLQDKNGIESWDSTEIEQLRFDLLLRINKTINFGNARTKTNKKYLKYISMAAAFILLWGLGVVLFSNTTENPVEKNAITLELEDGSIQALDENGSFTIHNIKGESIGIQKGKELVYGTRQEAKQLVYNSISVPYGKTFGIQLSDGTKIKLNSGTSLKYPVQFIEGQDRSVYIVGEAFLEVAKDSVHPFVVRANNLNIRVLGTRFNVHAYPEDNVSEVVLVEGAVDLHQQGDRYTNNSSVQLSPGDMASFSKTDKSITKNKVITQVYTSWMHGELVFRNMDFANILKKMERHFNVEIINTNTSLVGQKFQASFGEDPDMIEVFNELKMIYGIDYSIQENTITIK